MATKSRAPEWAIPIGKRVYSDLPEGAQIPLLNKLVAMVTLSLYCGWMNVLVLLFFAAFWSRIAL